MPVASLQRQVVGHRPRAAVVIERVTPAVLNLVEREGAAFHREARHRDALVLGHAPAVQAGDQQRDDAALDAGAQVARQVLHALPQRARQPARCEQALELLAHVGHRLREVLLRGGELRLGGLGAVAQVGLGGDGGVALRDHGGVVGEGGLGGRGGRGDLGISGGGRQAQEGEEFGAGVHARFLSAWGFGI